MSNIKDTILADLTVRLADLGDHFGTYMESVMNDTAIHESELDCQCSCVDSDDEDMEDEDMEDEDMEDEDEYDEDEDMATVSVR